MPTAIVLILLAAAAAPVDGPAPPGAAKAAVPEPAFRLTILKFEADKRPIGRGEVIASKGRLYYLEKDSNEVLILDRAGRAAHLVDIKLGLAADVALRAIDEEVAANREAQRKAVEIHAQSKARADRVDAEMRRDMTDPRFRTEYDEATRTLRLANPTAQVVARGEPEDDPARLAAVSEALGTVAKLRAYRDPDNLRYLVEIAALSSLIDGRKLRPAEVTYLFRLTGPPEKHRWTYALVPDLTEQDRAGLDLIEARLSKARHVPLERFDRRLDPDDLK